MGDTSKHEVRGELSKRFADVVEQYQQNHRRLMDALYDNGISIEAFEMLSEQIREDVNALKRIKLELKRQRDALEP